MHVIGREGEISTVLGLVGGVLVVTGEPGTGKSTLLSLAADAAGPGRRVLRATGSHSESNLPFSGLHQLLRPVFDEIERLPERQRSALRGAIGLEDGAPAPMMIGVAVLTLLSEVSERTPLLAVVDDIGLFDQCSRDTLAFVARRIGDEPLALLIGALDETEFPGFASITLDPLEPLAAATLLDAQPSAPTGRRRARVLAQADGNPLALVELSRTGRDDVILPLPDRLERVHSAGLDRLPSATRSALLLVAADAAGLVAGTRSAALAPAEEAGLIRLSGGRARFRHPLVRSAIYHSATSAERLEAHRALADLLVDAPDRRAWHLAAATIGPDESVAAALEATTPRARLRCGHAAAAAALERAAELSPVPSERARRLVAAAGAAADAGQPTWVEQLATEARTFTDDPLLLATAALRVGQVLSLTCHHDTSLGLLMRAAEEPALTAQALSAAAVGTFHSGAAADRAVVRARSVGDPRVRVLVDPDEHRATAASIPELLDRAGSDPGALTSVAVMAWLLDETALAVRIFADARQHRRALGQTPSALECSAAWAHLDHGQWAQARSTAAGADAASSADASLPQRAAGDLVLDATAAALTGDTSTARAWVERALSMIDPRTSRAVLARAGWALGMAAVADGDHSTAYEHFRRLFTAEGEPVHYHFAYVAVAELVAAAVRTGHEAEAGRILRRAEKEAHDASPRIGALLHRGHALLDHDGAEAHFREALSDAATEQWPFERAQLLLEYGEWLRRRRRILEARPMLVTASEVFGRLGAGPWLDRTRGELRAAGIGSEPTGSEPAGRDALTLLTPQQQQIIGLAARGLTNREIGARLFISPRTVSSHLYRSYPVLGISSRAQLRDIVDGVTTRPVR
ncbi:DNA-binding CsgD family transcriptional regulator [Streptomyces aurantiacus]|uniref:AAA family ATPase n=1 Tax=Streptomyces aurantiacus TaxID=47760 RepID=UPI00278CCCFE|nr:AAA family ATPase [Streptomyces aurantiacus]MDQ0778946.1 DNA-binding CsgD family transcriptional regulator [Streptomyces aurantiacus]